MTNDCSCKTATNDALPNTISLAEIKAKCDSLWQQTAAVRPPAEGGPTPTPVAPLPMQEYEYPK